MKDIQQLIKKNNQEGRYNDIFPKTFLDAVRDRQTGITLTDILAGFNMYFLSYVGSSKDTRLQVPKFFRKTGLWITYVRYDKTIVTEWYAGDDISDEAWGLDSNWRIGSNMLVGDITISSEGNWIVNGVDTGVKAQGEQGITPLLRIYDNKLQVSYTNGASYIDINDTPVYTQFKEEGNKLQQSTDLGKTWVTISDYIAAWFRWVSEEHGTAGYQLGKIQISRDNGSSWTDLSGYFTNNLHIKDYVSTVGELPSSAALGDIYGVGPTYDTSDTEHTNPIYRLYVKTDSGWIDNGQFTSISAGVVQELGDSETEVMSQKGVTDNIHKYSSYGSDFAISGGYHPIIHCFKNTHIFDPKGVNGYRIQVAGYNSSSKNISFYFIDADESDVTTESAYTYDRVSELAPTGIIHYDFTSKGIRFVFDFDWNCFNNIVGDIFNVSAHQDIIITKFSDSDIESLGTIKNLLYSKGFSIHGDITINHLHIWLCIVNLKIYDKKGPSEFKINQQGLSSSTGNAIFYYQRISDNALVEYNLANPVTTGVQHYEFVSNAVRVELDFNWDIYNQYFTNRFGNITKEDYLSFTSSPIEEVNEYFLTKGFSIVSSFSTSNIRLTKVISNFKAWYYGLAGETDLKYQFRQHGILNNKTGIIFYYQRYGAEGNNEIVEYQIPYVEENCTGIRHYCLEDKTIKVEFDWDWDVYKELFPTDLYRMTTDLPLVFPVSKIEVESDSSENYSLGNKITVKSGSKVMLVGASFASSLNGWFELACSKIGITAVNRAIGGQNIINNVAERMLDADETMPHGSLFYVDGKDIFEEVEAFVLMMTHNNDVYLSDKAYQSNTLEYYKENGVGTDRAAAFDYVIKQYKQWCAEYTVSQHRTSAGQEIDDVIGTKECQILICSNWHCGRAIYNNSSKKLAERFGLSYCDFTANDNLGANHLITATINTDTSLSPVKGQYHPSVLYAHFDSYYQGAWAGKTEVIGGITYGWHPQVRSTTYDYGNTQESDGYYYPDIQYILAGIFKSCVELL